VAGRDFLGGHYISDKFGNREEIRDYLEDMNRHGRGCTNFMDSKPYSK